MSEEPTSNDKNYADSPDRMVIDEEDLMKDKHRRKKQKKSTKSAQTSATSSKSDQTAKKSKKNKPPRTKKQKIILGILIALAVILAIALGVLIYFLLQKPDEIDLERVEFAEPIYSTLTGEEIPTKDIDTNPTFCVQIPNGNDGGRPQAGLSQAGVVFEAIAEAGITRFAAIFQNAGTSVIGPIRSLRPYYLDWDTPFDCTVVHAGGSDEAIAALRAGGQRDLNENPNYMWREQGSGRGWNNLFTSPAKLLEFNQANGFDQSQISGFPHLTPDETTELLSQHFNLSCDIQPGETTCIEIATEESSDENDNNDDNNADATDLGGSADSAPEFFSANQINFVLGNSSIFNIVYTYDPATNSYLRSYANGEAHLVYDCPSDLTEPNTKTQCGSDALVQVAPKAVVAMSVSEKRMSDGYHEDITTIGNGKAYIFQNGEAIEGTWTKNSQKDQIVFRDSAGEEIRFTPGQLWITAIPQYGGVRWE